MRSLAAALLALAVASGAARAAPPQTIAYQGYLTTNAGAPVNGNVSITFSLYGSQGAPKPLWAETQNVVVVTSGHYAVTLGNVTPLTLAFDQQYWLGVKVGTDAEMTPRQALTSAPYALRAANVSYASARTGHANVHATAFFPFNSSTAYSGFGNGRYLSDGSDSAGDLMGSVSLPHGVTMTELSCWVYDNSPADLQIGLVDGLANLLYCGWAISSGASGSVQELTAPCSASVVDNATKSYYIRFQVFNVATCGENCRIHGCRVTYTYTEEGR
jgi:hypothetical protein